MVWGLHFATSWTTEEGKRARTLEILHNYSEHIQSRSITVTFINPRRITEQFILLRPVPARPADYAFSRDKIPRGNVIHFRSTFESLFSRAL